MDSNNSDDGRHMEVVLRMTGEESGLERDYPFMIRSDGIWQVNDEDEKTIIKSIEHDSDRAAAIVAASMIEARLDRAMLDLFNYDKQIYARTFQPGGPVGAFGTKIDMAFMLHLISKEAHTDLMVLKNIRNKFAHDLSVKDFGSASIKDRIKNLKLVDKYLAQGREGPGEKIIDFTRPLNKPFLFVIDYNKNKNNPRRRYMFTVQMFLAGFAVRLVSGKPTPLI